MIYTVFPKAFLPAGFLAASLLFACKQKKEAAVPETKTEVKAETVSPYTITDSVVSGCNAFATADAKPIAATGLFEPDGYPVEEELLNDNVVTARQSKYFSTGDAAWFRNDTLNQVLIMSVATDNFRSGFINFSYKEFPGILISEVPLWLQDDKPVADSVLNREKKMILPSFIDSAKQIPARYFTTIKGFKFGDCREKALQVYGKPHELKTSGAVEILKWQYEGDFDGDQQPDGKLLAKGTYGHTVTMYFRNNRLIGLTIYNDIP